VNTQHEGEKDVGTKKTRNRRRGCGGGGGKRRKKSAGTQQSPNSQKKVEEKKNYGEETPGGRSSGGEESCRGTLEGEKCTSLITEKSLELGSKRQAQPRREPIRKCRRSLGVLKLKREWGRATRATNGAGGEGGVNSEL